MIKIEYPAYKPKIKVEDSRELIFDEIRKQWFQLTPEEWVRQNFLQYLIYVKGYPASWIAVEKEIMLGDMKKRFDIVVFNGASKPWMIIECKEMNVALSESVLNQVMRYNINLQAPYLVITNGHYCYGFESREGRFTGIPDLPDLV